jgi:hypothetical protein
MEMSDRAEIEKLARTLKASRVATSESDAWRMAEEMLSTSKKVQDDFKAKDKALYNREKNPEVETARAIMEKLSANMAKGMSNVRLDLKELDLNKPLKELIPAEEALSEHEEDDDAVLVNDESLLPKKEESPIELQPPVSIAPVGPEVINMDDDDDSFDRDPDDDTEEEKPELPTSFVSAEVPEKKEEEDEEFSVKEL